MTTTSLPMADAEPRIVAVQDSAPLLRALHLIAFGLWVGGALWNLTVAIPVGVRHPNFAAITAGAYQLQRFRWVARVSLPTIIATGVLIVALIVVFITCPLYRQCCPVAGVCDLDDLHDRAASSRSSVERGGSR